MFVCFFKTTGEKGHTENDASVHALNINYQDSMLQIRGVARKFLMEGHDLELIYTHKKHAHVYVKHY